MLQSKFTAFLQQHEQTIEQTHLSQQEYNYVNQNELQIAQQWVLAPNASKVLHPYIERVNKETDESIAVMDESFLQSDSSFLYKKLTEYVYIESTWFDLVGIDGVSIEVDDVFHNIELMFGLKLQKKKTDQIKAFFSKTLQLNEGRLSLLFNNSDGLFDVNVSLESIPGYHQEMTFEEIINTLYTLLFSLQVELEQA